MRTVESASVPDLAAVAAQAFADGVAAARAETADADAQRRALVAELERTVVQAAAIDAAILRAPFAALVTHLAEAVVGAELRLSPEIVQRLVDGALARLGPDGATSLRLHPGDAAAFGGLGTLPVVIDADQPRGSVIIDYPRMIVADGLPARLAAIVAALE